MLVALTASAKEETIFLVDEYSKWERDIKDIDGTEYYNMKWNHYEGFVLTADLTYLAAVDNISNVTRSNDKALRMIKSAGKVEGMHFIIEHPSATMSKVVLEYRSPSTYHNVTSTDGRSVYDAAAGTITWEGKSSKVEFCVSDEENIDVRTNAFISTAKITYTAGLAPEVTVTDASGNALEGDVVISAPLTITLNCNGDADLFYRFTPEAADADAQPATYADAERLTIGDKTFDKHDGSALTITQAGVLEYVTRHLDTVGDIHSITFKGDTTGALPTAVDADSASRRYYTLQGVAVDGDNLAPGIYICRQGNTISKIVVR